MAWNANWKQANDQKIKWQIILENNQNTLNYITWDSVA